MTGMAPNSSPSARGCRRSAAVVDDDAQVLDAMATLLEVEGFEVEKFRDGQAAYEAFRHAQPDIAIIDLVMPRMDGMELLKRVRENWDFPVIMVTGGHDEVDEALGLRLGADDYVHKPWSARLLMERIRATLRRSSAARRPADATEATTKEILSRGPLVIDPERHEVTWRGHGINLTVTEFQLLEALARRPGVVKSRDQLMDVAYNDQVYVDDRTIDSHIKRLRKKLRSVDPDFSAIETLYGVGYRFCDPSVLQTID